MSQAVPQNFGRVDDDGTVFLVTADGERSIGQVPGASPEEAMAFFTRRYEALVTEVELLTERINRGSIGPDEARRSVETVRSHVVGANAVGDLAALEAQLDALTPAIEKAAEERKAERARLQDEAKEAKLGLVAQAEKLAEGNDWRGGVNQFRTLLDEWKALPRIDRATDDELWHRFSTARTTYTRRRKSQFAEQNAKRDSAAAEKQRIITQARALADSTDWGPTAGAFRDLMTKWKAAGAASREVDDQLWAEFRGIQDEFFARRQQVFSEQDAEFAKNLEAKQELLDTAESEILPVTDVATARAKFRDFLTKFNEYGKVPRDQIRVLDKRVKAIESAIREEEDNQWRRTDPETRERASGTAAMLSDQIDKLTAELKTAEAAGNTSKAKDLQQSIETYRSWLDQANRTLEDFTA